MNEIREMNEDSLSPKPMESPPTTFIHPLRPSSVHRISHHFSDPAVHMTNVDFDGPYQSEYYTSAGSEVYVDEN